MSCWTRCVCRGRDCRQRAGRRQQAGRQRRRVHVGAGSSSGHTRRHSVTGGCTCMCQTCHNLRTLRPVPHCCCPAAGDGLRLPPVHRGTDPARVHQDRLIQDGGELRQWGSIAATAADRAAVVRTAISTCAAAAALAPRPSISVQSSTAPGFDPSSMLPLPAGCGEATHGSHQRCLMAQRRHQVGC